jgi:hypothetical protein
MSMMPTDNDKILDRIYPGRKLLKKKRDELMKMKTRNPVQKVIQNVLGKLPNQRF